LSARLGRAALGLALAATVNGCSLNFDATSLGVPVTMASPVSQPAVGDSFRVSSHALWAFWGLGKLKRPALNKALATQLAGGKGIADLKIKTHTSFSDLLITLLTGGVMVPRSVIFEGVVTGGEPAK
jgi:hypothetical protein